MTINNRKFALNSQKRDGFPANDQFPLWSPQQWMMQELALGVPSLTGTSFVGIVNILGGPVNPTGGDGWSWARGNFHIGEIAVHWGNLNNTGGP
jgi:hypothetical protein